MKKFNSSLIGLLAVLVLLLSGCAGGGYRGGIGETSGDYTPNYISDIRTRTWPVNDLTYSITGGKSSVPLIDQPRTVKRGFSHWEPTIRNLFTLKESDGSRPADIQVEIVEGGEFTEPGRIGETGFTYVGGERGWVVTMRISRALLPVIQEKVATHEMGHALGIIGHSTKIPDIMYPQILPFLGITNRDNNTLRKIYDPDGDGHRAEEIAPGKIVVVCALTEADIKE